VFSLLDTSHSRRAFSARAFCAVFGGNARAAAAFPGEEAHTVAPAELAALTVHACVGGSKARIRGGATRPASYAAYQTLTAGAREARVVFARHVAGATWVKVDSTRRRRRRRRGSAGAAAAAAAEDAATDAAPAAAAAPTAATTAARVIDKCELRFLVRSGAPVMRGGRVRVGRGRVRWCRKWCRNLRFQVRGAPASSEARCD